MKSVYIVILIFSVMGLISKEYSVKGEKHLKLGMAMTRKRLDLLAKKYDVETGIEFSEVSPEAANPGTRVVLVVPLSQDGKL